MTRDKWLLIAGVFLAGLLGSVAPGCYADWSFVRNARNLVEPAQEQRIKALTDENEKLKAQLGTKQP